MARKLTLAALATLCCLLAAPAANARPLAFSGKVPGDPNARVLLKVVKRKGQPKRVTQLRFKRLDHECTDGVGRQYARAFPRRIEIGRLLTGKYNFFATGPHKQVPGFLPGSLFVSGETRRRARKVTVRRLSSTIKFPSDQPSGETTCIADSTRIVLRRAR